MHLHSMHNCICSQVMDIPKRISEIEDQLQDAKIKIGDVLYRARVDRSTWTRWKAGTVSPTISKWNAVELAVTEAMQALAA